MYIVIRNGVRIRVSTLRYFDLPKNRMLTVLSNLLKMNEFLVLSVGGVRLLYLIVTKSSGYSAVMC